MRRAVSLWLPVIACLALSFYLSSRPGRDLPNLMPDYVAHGIEFLVLSSLVLRALNGGTGRRPGAGTYAAAILFCLAWAILDEFHQSFVPGREASPVDVASDMAGTALGGALFSWLRRLVPPGW